MAQQSSFYNTDGTTRTYPSSKHIASKQHVAVYFKSVTTSVWAITEQSLYDIVNNSIVFVASPDTALYSEIEIRVADTAAELIDSPSDIAIVSGSIANVNTVATSISGVNTVATNIAQVSTVSGSIANVNTVAGSIANVNATAGSIANVNAVATNILDVNSVATTIVPNIAEILLADTSAATATTQAGIATTQAGIATTQAGIATTKAAEATASALSINDANIVHKTGDETIAGIKTFSSSPIMPTVADGDSSTKGATTAFVASAIPYNTHAATSKATPVDADELPLLDSAASFGLKKLTWANIVAGIAGVFVDLTTNQTISGIKSFVSNILTPNIAYKSTPVTVTSWSYVTTTITLNVASHTFIAGDYIEVSGLTATTNIPNGIHLVTSVTATTIVFTYTLTPTGTAGVSSATVKGYVTTNGRTNGIGEGQTWQDVTASRALSTTYTNTTGKPISVKVTSNPGTSVSLQVTVSGILISNGTPYNGGNIIQDFIVPNSATYTVTISGATISKWVELR